MLFHKMGSTTGDQQQRVAGRHFVGMRLRVWTMRSMFMVTQWGVHRMYQRQYVKILHLALSKDGRSVLQEIGHRALCPGTALGARPYLGSEYKFPPSNMNVHPGAARNQVLARNCPPTWLCSLCFGSGKENHTTLGEKVAGQKTKEDNSLESPD